MLFSYFSRLFIYFQVKKKKQQTNNNFSIYVSYNMIQIKKKTKKLENATHKKEKEKLT